MTFAALWLAESFLRDLLVNELSKDFSIDEQKWSIVDWDFNIFHFLCVALFCLFVLFITFFILWLLCMFHWVSFITSTWFRQQSPSGFPYDSCRILCFVCVLIHLFDCISCIWLSLCLYSCLSDQYWSASTHVRWSNMRTYTNTQILNYTQSFKKIYQSSITHRNYCHDSISLLFSSNQIYSDLYVSRMSRQLE